MLLSDKFTREATLTSVELPAAKLEMLLGDKETLKAPDAERAIFARLAFPVFVTLIIPPCVLVSD
jgi:hypothetical protein